MYTQATPVPPPFGCITPPTPLGLPCLAMPLGHVPWAMPPKISLPLAMPPSLAMLLSALPLPPEPYSLWPWPTPCELQFSCVGPSLSALRGYPRISFWMQDSAGNLERLHDSWHCRCSPRKGERLSLMCTKSEWNERYFHCDHIWTAKINEERRGHWMD